jgi:hypothetical protein
MTEDRTDDLAFLDWMRAASPETLAVLHMQYLRSKAVPAAQKPCEACSSTGRIIRVEGAQAAAGEYCTCAMGRDLARVMARRAREAGAE